MAEQKKRFWLFVKASRAMRMFLFVSTLFVMTGIWLTGFDQVHWFIYIVPAFFTFAWLFGICPGINMWRKVFGET